ncbi:ComF family protein [Oscillospiraceae bacterium CM]|nr:ComF family protein [Oscillospiraceae bacterium CM]
MRFLSEILDLLFPPKCIFCGKHFKNGEVCCCDACAKTLPFTKAADVSQKGNYFDECVSPLFYAGMVRKSIHRYKFKGAAAYADCYGKLLAACIRDNLAGKFDLITWVPLSRNRERERGYDQAMLLACAAALALGDVAAETLVKNANIPAQSSLTGGETRRANVIGVYDVKDHELVCGKRILIIDDIITTGSTLSECARTLLLAGAESVVGAALARAT